MTPGPWVVQGYHEDGEFRVYGIYAGKKRIVETDAGCYPPALADAHLIAAAPDLYAAAMATIPVLDAVQREYTRMAVSRGMEVGDGGPILVQLRAAVAKAEGRT